jgi:hypothetical protein
MAVGTCVKKNVILNLALFFLWHVVWPHGLGGPADTFSSGLVIAPIAG